MVFAVLLSACGGGVAVGDGFTVTAQIGPAGGTLTGPDGVQVVIPAGALSSTITIGITKAGAGAPALPSDFPQTGPLYEFTPHDVVFQLPVTIRMPVPAGAQDNVAFMASLGGEWQALDTIVVDGFANWQRNSFSFGTVGANCSGRNDPYQCVLPRSSVRVSATPTTGLTAIPLVVGGGFGVPPIYGLPIHFTVSEASVVRLTLQYAAAPDCLNPSVRLIKVNAALPASDPNRVQVLMDQPTSLVTASFPNPNVIGPVLIRGVGTSTFDIPFSHLDTLANPIGQSMYGYTFRCNRPNRPTFSTGELLVFTSTVPTPAVSYGIGGSVSGLTGAGLILRNNGGDDLAIATSGNFTFATPVGAGIAYAVSVRSQPAGQTCSVANGSGTANAAVSNVAVTCAATGTAKAWQTAALLENQLDHASGPNVRFDANGNAIALWSQALAGISSHQRIVTRRYTPSGGWGPVEPIPVNADLWDFYGAEIAFDPLGNAIAVFTGYTSAGPEILTARYTASTSSWGTATLISSNGYGPDIAIDGAGNALLVWVNRAAGGLTSVGYAGYNASTSQWGAMQVISSGVGNTAVGNPRIATDTNGNAVAIWPDLAAAPADSLRASRFVPGNGWSVEQTISAPVASNYLAIEQKIAFSPAENSFVAVWAQHDGASFNVFTRRLAGAGTSWGVHSLVENSSDLANRPELAADGLGNVTVVWFQTDASNMFSTWARRYTFGAGGTAQRIDNNQSFVGDNGRGGQGAIHVASNGNGDTVAVWEQEGRIWSARLTAGTGWTTAEIINGTAPTGTPLYPRTAVDANGNALAVWEQFDGTKDDIWANVLR